jgi:hypothetical protein
MNERLPSCIHVSQGRGRRGRGNRGGSGRNQQVGRKGRMLREGLRLGLVGGGG